jgi:hypothetical protein
VTILAAVALVSSCAGREPATSNSADSPAGSTMASLPSLTTVPETTPQTRFVPNPPAEGSSVCDRFGTIRNAGTVAAADITEASGIVASRTHAGFFWTHNDSGGDPAVYAMDATGAALGTWTLEGRFALDWEDIALGPGPEPGIDYLYVGDIGDNLAFRPDVTVYRFPEPDPTRTGVVTDAVSLRLGYPIPPVDAEAMFVDPIDGDLVIVTKSSTGESVVLQATATSLGSDPIIPLFEIARVELGAGSFVTAADISPDGTMIALRGYDEVWMWARNDRAIAEAFLAAPCTAPATEEVQGEALAFTSDGTAYVTISEGSNPTVWRVES